MYCLSQAPRGLQGRFTSFDCGVMLPLICAIDLFDFILLPGLNFPLEDGVVLVVGVAVDDKVLLNEFDLIFTFVVCLIVFVDIPKEDCASQRFLASLELSCFCVNFWDLVFLCLEFPFVLIEVLNRGCHDFLVQSLLNWIIFVAPDIEVLVNDVKHV